MLEIMIFIIIVIAIKFIVTKLLRKKFNIITYPNSDRYINNTHKWGEGILRLLAITLFILSYFFEYLIFGLVFILLLMLIFSAYMEYKHEREEREYIITIAETLMYLILIIGAPILYFS